MPGYFCNSTLLLCQDLQLEDQYCSNDYECANNLLCNFNTCVEYYSLSLGQLTDNINYNGFSEACQTGFAVKNNNNDAVCAIAPMSQQWPNLCSPGSLCYDIRSLYSKPCTCGYTEDGSAYCPPFEGDPPLQMAIENQQVLMGINHICNTASRFSEVCFNHTKEYLGNFYAYAMNMTLYTNYPYLQSNSYCVKKVYTNEFWNLELEEEKWDKEEKDDHPGDHDDDELAESLILSLLIINYF